MSQLKFDLAEFVITNRDEIVHFLNEEMEHLKHAERLFDNYPEMYDELIQNWRRSKLAHYLASHYKEPFDNIYLIVDSDFVKMTLDY